MPIHYAMTIPGAALRPGKYLDLALLSVPLPQGALIGCWHARAGVLVDGSSVTSWTGPRGGAITPATTAARPVYAAGGMSAGKPSVLFDGVDDLISTGVAPPAAGYLVLKFRHPADLTGTSTRTIVGGETSTTQRLRVGTLGGKIVAAIGNLTYSDLVSTTSVPAGSTHVVGLAWDGSTVRLRINGTQEDSGTYTGGAAAVGTAALAIGGNSLLSSYSYSHLALIGIYSADPGTLDLAAIDAAAAEY